MWEEIGKLQFEFIKKRATPDMKFLDVGCGAMRGGLHFISYFNSNNYYGIDSNKSLLKAAKIEIKNCKACENKKYNLYHNSSFRFDLFNTKFDLALAISVFSHLPSNNIILCLINMKKVLKPSGRFYATFFISPNSLYTKTIKHNPGGIITYFDRDPYHYSINEIKNMASLAKLNCKIIGDWSHPRNQQMVKFFL